MSCIGTHEKVSSLVVRECYFMGFSEKPFRERCNKQKQDTVEPFEKRAKNVLRQNCKPAPVSEKQLSATAAVKFFETKINRKSLDTKQKHRKT